MNISNAETPTMITIGFDRYDIGLNPSSIYTFLRKRLPQNIEFCGMVLSEEDILVYNLFLILDCKEKL